MRQHALRAVFIYKEPFWGRMERARLENSLIYVIVFPSAPHNDILRNNNTVFTSAPHPSLRDTFSPRVKAFIRTLNFAWYVGYCLSIIFYHVS